MKHLERSITSLEFVNTYENISENPNIADIFETVTGPVSHLFEKWSISG